MKSDLLSILKNLSLEEFKQLRLFLQNRYYSNSNNSFTLLEELFHYYPLFEIHPEDKTGIYKRIYGDAPYNDSTLRSLTHQLLTAVEDFLLLQHLKQNEIEKDLLLIKEYKNRRIDELFLCRTERLEKHFKEKENLFSQDNLLNRFKLNSLKVNYSISNERILHKITIESQLEGISTCSDYLALYFFIECINDYVITEIYKKTCDASSFKNTLDFSQIVNIETLKSRFQKNGDLLNIIELYETLFRLFCEFNNDQYYKEYRQRLYECKKFLVAKELTSHYHYLISYCIIKKNSKDNPEFYRHELWNLYVELLKSNLLVDDKSPFLDINLYRSILFLGLSLNFIPEIKIFIDNYSKKVNPAVYRNIVDFSYAYLNYEMGEYNKALGYAAGITTDDFILKYDIKNLLSKIYYDLGYWESLTSIINSYKEFLRNDSVLSSSLKNKIKQFITHIEYLTLYASKQDRVDVSYHLSKLKDEDTYCKDWLIKKYSEYLHVEYGYV